MPRPRLCKRIGLNPKVTFYKPQGIPLKHLKIIELNHEEWEALRLKNVEGLDQNQSAERMNTSQSTFQRILSQAQTIKKKFVGSKDLKISKKLFLFLRIWIKHWKYE